MERVEIRVPAWLHQAGAVWDALGLGVYPGQKTHPFLDRGFTMTGRDPEGPYLSTFDREAIGPGRAIILPVSREVTISCEGGGYAAVVEVRGVQKAGPYISKDTYLWHVREISYATNQESLGEAVGWTTFRLPEPAVPSGDDWPAWMQTALRLTLDWPNTHTKRCEAAWPIGEANGWRPIPVESDYSHSNDPRCRGGVLMHPYDRTIWGCPVCHGHVFDKQRFTMDALPDPTQVP